MRGATVALLGIALCSCTDANPDYLDPESACRAGQRGCVGTRPVLCQSDGTLATVACPTGAACAGGSCVQTASAPPCFSDRDCSGGRVCGAVVDATRPGVISTFCIAPEGLTEGVQACRGPQECRTALCLPAASGATLCYRACQSDGDCSAGTRCNNVEVEITGVRGTIRGCQPV